MTEKELVEKCKEHNDSAWKAFFEQYRGYIYAIIYRKGIREPADQDDVYQDTALKIITGIHRFGGNSSLKTWVFQVTRSACSNWWQNRFRYTERVVTKEDISDLPGGITWGDIENIDLEDLLRKTLSAREFCVVYWSVLGGLTYEEIGEMIDRSPSVVSRTKDKALEKIYKALQKS